MRGLRPQRRHGGASFRWVAAGVAAGSGGALCGALCGAYVGAVASFTSSSVADMNIFFLLISSSSTFI